MKKTNQLLSIKSHLFLLLSLIYLLNFSTFTFANAKNQGLKPQLMGHGQFGMPGCGFGSMVFEPKENKLFSMTLNHITSSQAFGISSGTSNCHDPLPSEINRAESLPEFIENNKMSISRDAARGSGETIKVLSQMLECNPKEVGHVLKTNYQKIFVETKMQSAGIEAHLNNLLNDDQKCFE